MILKKVEPRKETNKSNYCINNFKYYKYKKYCFYIVFAIILILIVLINSNFTYAADPKIVKKLSDAFEDIEDWILKLSTPAAAVAVGVGVFMKKFSFGDEEKMRMAKKVIRGSLFSYGFILAIDLILSAISSLID